MNLQAAFRSCLYFFAHFCLSAQKSYKRITLSDADLMNETGKTDRISLQAESVSVDEKISCLSVQSSDNKRHRGAVDAEMLWGFHIVEEVTTLES